LAIIMDFIFPAHENICELKFFWFFETRYFSNTLEPNRKNGNRTSGRRIDASIDQTKAKVGVLV